MYDENLYSRQIAVFGKDEMKSLINSKVKVIGIDGSSYELCKNLVLSGIGELCISESRSMKDDDLSVIYSANYEDINKPVNEVARRFLSELNPNVKILFEDYNNYDIHYDTYVLSNGKLEYALKLNKFTRENNLSFSWLNTYGLMGNIFCDFNNFNSSDIDGENLTESVIKEITNEYVETIGDPHNLQENDLVKIFNHDESSILDINFTVKQIISPNKFVLDNQFNLDVKNGKVIQLKRAMLFSHEPLSNQYENPSIINLDEDAYDLHNLFKCIHSNNFKTNSKFINEFKKTKYGKFVPIGSILGSYASQEVIKSVTKRFTPTNQWFYYHCYDILPNNFIPVVSRQDDKFNGLRNCIGNELVKKLMKSSIFIVGAGAIGCEHLKNLSMCGFGYENSQLVVTDMDSIEKSNLSRQFLFRNNDIGNMKSEVARDKIKEFSRGTNIISYTDRVSLNSENVFNTEFFDSIDLVANALDNIEARLYMDKRCIFYNKPLFECGTLGTKGNVQVIMPKVTEHYGATQDQSEKSFPVCTVKNFPNSIEHTIHWARNEFEELFKIYPENLRKYINDENILSKISGNEKGELISAVKYLYENKPNNFSDCIKFATNRFYEKYNFQIKNLLKSYPKDAVTSSGETFWSEGKVCPDFLNLDISNRLIFDYIYHTSILFAEMFNIEYDIEIYKETLNSVLDNSKEPDENSFTEEIHTDEKAQKEYEAKKLQDLNNETLPDYKEICNLNIKSFEFEKDDDENHHIDFIHCSSNLRASNYRIELIDRYDTKIKAGKIIPAIATTTSMISGLVTIEIIKFIFGKSNINDFKNTYLNLGLGFLTSSEPIDKEIFKINDKEFDIWDYYDVKENILVKDLFKMLSDYYNINIDTLIYDATLLISPMTFGEEKDKRLNMKLKEVLEYMKINEKKIYELQIDSLEYDEDVNFPNVRYFN